MEEWVQGCIRDLVFDLDEIGVSEWEDRKSRKAVVPSAMSSQTIHSGVNRNLKHIAVITCIAAGGEHRGPCSITSQESGDLRETPRKNGIEFRWQVILKKNQKSSVTEKSSAVTWAARTAGTNQCEFHTAIKKQRRALRTIFLSSAYGIHSSAL
jgi:hypothetical protein